MQEATDQEIKPVTQSWYTTSGIEIQARQVTANEWVTCQKRNVVYKAHPSDWVVVVGVRSYVMQNDVFRAQYVEQRS